MRAENRSARTFAAPDGSRAFVAAGVAVQFVGRCAPAVDGVLHSHILLPEGIDRVLTKTELNAVLPHELTHPKDATT